MIDELKTDYKDDVLATSQQGKRTFNIVGKNGEILFEDVHIEDTSRYLQVGDEYGQEIINEQNSAINQLSKGTGYVFDTYAEYLEAYQGGEIPVNAIVYIKEGSVDGTITALQVKYNDSNVKLALDALGTRIDGKQDKLTNPLTRSNIVDNLNSSSATNVLSAKQGKVLNDNFNEKFSYNTLLASGSNIGIKLTENKVYLIVASENSDSSNNKASMNIFSTVYGAGMVNVINQGGIYLNWTFDSNTKILTVYNLHPLFVALSITQL
jgi:hypothetical protein